MELKATTAARGIAIGNAFHYCAYVPQISDHIVEGSEIEAEILTYKNALKLAENELNLLVSRLRENREKQAAIFEAHVEILTDETMIDEIVESINAGMNASKAVHFVYTQYAEILKNADDPVLSERSADLLDVCGRLLRCIDGEEACDLSSLTEPVILIAHDLLPSDTATLNPEYVLGIITEVGGATSHSAIIARSFGIPAVAGIPNLSGKIQNNDMIVLDANDGCVVVNPTDEELSVYSAKQKDHIQKLQEEQKYKQVEACLNNGTHINVMTNVGSADERELACASYVDGVGLFRTEFLYMGRDTLPTEEEQFLCYKRVLEAFAPNPVTLRTLDIGGDKEVACLNLPKEENPFLGNRALRLCFSDEEMFLVQLRAALRASVYGKLKIMFPMVSGMEDIRKAKSLLNRAKEDLKAQGIAWDENLQVGTMIEIPALAIMADTLVNEVDFASIGTNDLTQYTVAADRINPAVSSYYQPNHPAVMRLINYVTKVFNKEGKTVSVCGEMGGDPLSAVALLGMGITSLSMGASSIARIKRIICNIDIDDANAVADQVCSADTAAAVKEILTSALKKIN